MRKIPVRVIDNGTLVMSTIDDSELEVGSWYCGFSEDGSQDDYGGAIAQYVGDGEFWDEDEYGGHNVDMRHYAYLIKQS